MSWCERVGIGRNSTRPSEYSTSRFVFSARYSFSDHCPWSGKSLATSHVGPGGDAGRSLVPLIAQRSWPRSAARNLRGVRDLSRKLALSRDGVAQRPQVIDLDLGRVTPSRRTRDRLRSRTPRAGAT